MNKMSLNLLALGFLVLTSNAMADASNSGPSPAQRKICFKFLKAQTVAPVGYATQSYAFSHTTVRRDTNAPEYVWQVEVAKTSLDQGFVYVTTDAQCTKIESVTGVTNQ